MAAHPRYGVWPGDDAVCLLVTMRAGGRTLGEGMWLYRQDGRVMELREYRYGMLRG